MAATSANALKWLRLGSGVVVGIYGLALCYRAGVARKILPTELNQRLEAAVDRIKQRTEPRSGSAQFNVARGHLIRAYGYASLGFALCGAGVLAFFAYPHLPIGAAVAATATSALALQMFPRSYFAREARLLTFACASLSCGYTMGPMNWIAQDTMLPVTLVIGSSMIGFGVPLLLTRGLVGYFFSTQLLSTSLAVASSAALVPKLDVNSFLTAQVAGNVLLGYFHTAPTIQVCLRWTDSLQKLEGQLDPLLEGFHICGAAAYGCWTVFQKLCMTVMMAVTRDRQLTQGASREERRYFRSFLSMTLDIDRWSRLVASALFLVVYVRVVSHMQRSGSTNRHLNNLRLVFYRLSPLHLLNQL